MIPATEVMRWLNTLRDDSCVGIDEDGLCLREIREEDVQYACMSVGGIPEEIEERWKRRGRRSANQVREPSAPPKETKMEQLLLNLESACEKVTKTVIELRHEATQGSPVDRSIPRKTANRLVGILSTQRGLPFHSAWVLAYHELYNRTGFHAVVSSKGDGTHLDAVESAGRMEDLIESLLTMLRA